MKPVEFCRLVENTLGWMPPAHLPPRKAHSIEAGRLNKRIAEDPKTFTWDNLLLTVEWLRRKRRTASPTGVTYYVTKAIAEANRQVTSDVTAAMRNAMEEAFLAGEPEWVDRLVRAVGDARHEVLAEWNDHASGALR